MTQITIPEKVASSGLLAGVLIFIIAIFYTRADKADGSELFVIYTLTIVIIAYILWWIHKENRLKEVDDDSLDFRGFAPF